MNPKSISHITNSISRAARAFSLAGRASILILAPALCLPAGAVPVPPTDNTSAPYMGVYEWSISDANNHARITYAANWLSRSQLWAEEFSATDSWDQLRGPDWLLGSVKWWTDLNSNSKCVLTIGMLPGPWDGSGPTTGINKNVPVSLATGATGAYNGHWQVLAQNLVAKSLVDKIVIRLGHEFNGGWYTWRADTQAKGVSYAEYWRQIVTTMRAVPGASGLKFCWNGATGWSAYNLIDAYPGDAYVDSIGADVYDQSWAANTYPYPAGATAAQILTRQQNAWNDVAGTGNNGMGWWRNLAVSHGKQFVIPEWGLCNRSDNHGGMDNPYYVQKMYDFIHEPSNNVGWHIYFDIQAGDGHHQVTPINGFVTEFPVAAALYRQLFAPGGVVFNDEFTDGNAQGWTANPAASWTIASDASNYAYAHTVNWSSPEAYSTTGQNTWTNYTLSAAVKITSLPTWSETRVFGRYVDASNYYVAILADEGGASWRRAYIKRRLNGVTTVLASAWISFSGNIWNHLDFSLNGSQLTFKLNGTQLLQATDSSIPAGRIGIGSNKQNMLFDDITVTSF